MNRLRRNKVKAGALALALTFFFASAWIFTRPPADPFRGDAIVDPPFTPLTYGVQTFLWWDYTRAAKNLDMVRLMVFSHVKQIFAWEDLEPAPGEWDFRRADEILEEIERRDLELVVRLSDAPEWSHPSVEGRKDEDFIDAPPDDYALFGEYCRQIATRYKGRIAAYQIWNEPNLSREWGNRAPDAKAYVELLKVCSEAIRAADPAAILISSGLSPTGTHDDTAHRDDLFLQAMYNEGFQQYIDVVGVHAPGFSPPEYGPDDAERDGRGRWATFRRVEDLRKIMIANGDAARQMAILEMGYTMDPVNPDYAWFAVEDDLEQARMLVEAYKYVADHWRPWVGLVSAIYIADPSWTEEDEEYWWAITNANGSIRWAYADLANMEKFCGERYVPARDPKSPEAQGLATVVPCD
jgi:polysaccharide biosynthesis protein PslG